MTTGKIVISWTHLLHQVTGAIALRGYQADLGAEEVDGWAQILAAVAKEMKAEAKRIGKGRK